MLSVSDTCEKLGQCDLVYWSDRSRAASWTSLPVGCLFTQQKQRGMYDVNVANWDVQGTPGWMSRIPSTIGCKTSVRTLQHGWSMHDTCTHRTPTSSLCSMYCVSGRSRRRGILLAVQDNAEWIRPWGGPSTSASSQVPLIVNSVLIHHTRRVRLVSVWCGLGRQPCPLQWQSQFPQWQNSRSFFANPRSVRDGGVGRQNVTVSRSGVPGRR